MSAINELTISAAPLQGYTRRTWRECHKTLFGGIDRYYAPFIRIEKGQPRSRDLNDIMPTPDDNASVIPQIIFGSVDEFRILVEAVGRAGHKSVDLNMGCPFPPQVKRHRGVGILTRPDILSDIAETMGDYPTMKFSAKMRLGVDDTDQWRSIAGILNDMPLVRLTVHPRTARQQYSGTIDCDAFEEMTATIVHPIVYNGDITSTDDITGIIRRFPTVSGVMIGRGLLSRPSLAAEWRSGKEWNREKRIDGIRKLHEMILQRFSATLCGDSQILANIKPFWDYLENEIGRKALKAIKKADSMEKYLSATGEIQ